MTAYYNEFNPEAAAMLRQLISDGLIAYGDVDERPIQEVKADDLQGYTQCHFFAGIGGWSIALRLAEWPDDRPVWTGSCPCQPFSTSGKQKGKLDERHLWPEWFRLIRECRPSAIFGEQVERAIAHGWLDDVYNDMEGQDYAVGAAVLPACAIGKPHQRKRLWFVGSAQHDGQFSRQVAGSEEQTIQHDTQGADCASKSEGASQSEHVANAERLRRQRQRTLGESLCSEKSKKRKANRPFDDSAGMRWIACPDEKSRPVEPSISLLAHGVQHRAPILHAFGNAIVPQVAAEFIKAYMQVTYDISSEY